MGRIALAFLVGHCCIHALAELPGVEYFIVLLLGLVLAAMFRAVPIAALVLGLGWAWGNASLRVHEDLSPQVEGEDVLVRGSIASLPDASGRDVRFSFDVSQSQVALPRRLQLSWYEADSRVSVGESWQFVVRLKRRNGFANPGGFDYEAHLFRAGVGATGYIRDDARNRRLLRDESPIGRYSIDRARAWIAQRMREAVSRPTMLGVLQGLAIGDTRQMTSEQWEVFARTGTTHLMAISGLHITMLAALAAWLGGAIVRWPRAQERGWSAVHGQVVAGLSAAFGYSLLAGFSVPTQRTLIMLGVYFLARWCRRELPIGHALGVALVGILLIDPFAPLSVGAWLSFGAVAVIVCASCGRLVQEHAVRGFVRVQAAITVGLLPLLLAAFGSVSLIAPLANCIAVPLFTLLLIPIILAGTVLACIWPPLGRPPLDLATSIMEAAWQPLQWAASQPLALWHFPEPTLVSLTALGLGAALCVLPAIWPLRLVAAVLCLQAFVPSTQGPPHGAFELAVLDVGQGLAVVVRTRSHVLVYDAGPAFQTGRDAAELAVLPYLHARAIRALDALVISHGDLDHRGGADTLLDAMPVERVLAGPSVRTLAEAEPCVQGLSWEWDEVSFEIMHPGVGAVLDDNDSSCVLRVSGSGAAALLTGDIEAGVEHVLVSDGIEPAQIVVGPHHGSRTSSSESFVSSLRARLAIFSAGYRNRWKLPNEEVLQRWRRSGARIMTTARSGAVEVSVDAAGHLRVREHRKAARRYWWRSG